jgi:DNA adenine methylase
MTFLKWAGGKRQLVPKLIELLPADLQARQYFEPMVGGGALYFALREHELVDPCKLAVLCDSNTQLITTYHYVRTQPDELIKHLNAWKLVSYAAMRDLFNAGLTSDKVGSCEQAARFIWLNKMCFNGIYRVNKSGLFNVPKGSREILPDLADNICKASRHLQQAELRIADFDDVINGIGSNSFVYFDPPYLGDYTQYTETGFDFSEWCKLRWLCGQLDKRRVLWMLSSNADLRVHDLFSTYNIVEVDAVRAINSDGAGRGAVKELVIRNYE